MEPSRCWNNDAVSVLHLQLPRRRSITYTSLFQNNQYVRLLNLILQLELGCIELYQNCREELENYALTGMIECHQQQAKSLVTMIITNRGIPAQKGFAFSSELSLIASRIARRLPQTIARRTSVASSLQLERTLRRRYYQALSMAPYRDRIELNSHIRATKLHIEHLQKNTNLY